MYKWPYKNGLDNAAIDDVQAALVIRGVACQENLVNIKTANNE